MLLLLFLFCRRVEMSLNCLWPFWWSMKSNPIFHQASTEKCEYFWEVHGGTNLGCSSKGPTLSIWGSECEPHEAAINSRLCGAAGRSVVFFGRHWAMALRVLTTNRRGFKRHNWRSWLCFVGGETQRFFETKTGPRLGENDELNLTWAAFIIVFQTD